MFFRDTVKTWRGKPQAEENIGKVHIYAYLLQDLYSEYIKNSCTSIIIKLATKKNKQEVFTNILLNKNSK